MLVEIVSAGEILGRWSKQAEPPVGQLRFSSKDVVDFASTLVKAVAGNLSSSYFSTGGDEINTKCYEADEQFQQESTRRVLRSILPWTPSFKSFKDLWPR